MKIDTKRFQFEISGVRNFIKKDWEATKGKRLWAIFFTGVVLVAITESCIQGYYQDNHAYFFTALWQAMYLTMFFLLQITERDREWWRNYTKDWGKLVVEQSHMLQSERESWIKILKSTEDYRNGSELLINSVRKMEETYAIYKK